MILRGKDIVRFVEFTRQACLGHDERMGERECQQIASWYDDIDMLKNEHVVYNICVELCFHFVKNFY